MNGFGRIAVRHRPVSGGSPREVMSRRSRRLTKGVVIACPSAMNATTDQQAQAPESTAVRVALWRAMHVQVDAPPHVLEDEIGLQLAAPPDFWRQRPDMDVR